jgi:penicillin G amidase
MNWLKFLAAFACTGLLIWVLNKTWILTDSETKKQTQTPRFGQFFSPNTGFWQQAEGKLPNLRRSLSSDKLKDKVEVFYDDRLVPHIIAGNTHDAWFVQGYVTASLRLWQMEFQTHASAGRLSELIGHTTPQVVDVDREARRFGLPKAARETVELWKKDTAMFALIQAYSDGVNAYISSLSEADYPIEYKLLDYAPEAWSPYKSALLLKYMAKDLTGMDKDFNMTNAYQFFGKNMFDRLYPEYFPEQSPIIQDSFWKFAASVVSPSFKRDTVRPLLSEHFYENPSSETFVKGAGSNNWAVAPRKTSGGKAILCNDPHLRLNLPSIWFEIQIQTPEFNVYGASLPGSPGVISGFNEHVAWGITNVSHDVKDWYRIQWKDASRTEYMLDSAWVKATHILDTVHIRGGQMRVDTLIYTHWGPVAYSKNGEDIALRWVAHLPSNEPYTFYGLNKAKNFQDYQNAIQHFSCPAQNMVFADVNGDIAMTVQGKLPVRKLGQGKFIQDGSKTAGAWTEFIPQAHLPQEYNPAKGFVGSANQHSTNPTYPYYYYGYFEEYRGRYLNQKLARMSNISIDSMKNLQNDNYSVRGRDMLPLLLKHLRRTDLTEKDHFELLAQVEKWDYVYAPNSVAATIFEAWMNQLYLYVYDELLKYNIDKGYDNFNKLDYPEEWALMGLLKRDTLNPVLDYQPTSNKIEKAADVVTEAFKRTYEELSKDKNISKDLADWKTTKASRVAHIARIDPFSFFNIPIGGHGSALNAMTATHGPSWKMVVELGGKAFGIYPGGQSGNVGSAFYASMLDTWAKGEYYELLFAKDKQTLESKSVFGQTFSK